MAGGRWGTTGPVLATLAVWGLIFAPVWGQRYEESQLEDGEYKMRMRCCRISLSFLFIWFSAVLLFDLRTVSER